jgi:hypothetical protein
MRYEPEPARTPCGPTLDPAECACGCSGYDDACDYYVWAYHHWKRTVPEHTCRATNPKARLNALEWPQDGRYVTNSQGQQVPY